MSGDATRSLLICCVWVLKHADRRMLRAWWSELGPGRLSQLLELLYTTVSNFEYKVSVGRGQRAKVRVH